MQLTLTSCDWSNPFLIAFVLLPPGLIAWRVWRDRYLRLSILFWSCLLIGWICLIVGFEYQQNCLLAHIKSMSNPSRELWDTWASGDGAKGIAVIMFGWIYSSIYFLLWAAPIWLGFKVYCFYLRWRSR